MTHPSVDMSLHEITEKISVIDVPLAGRSKVLGTYLIEGEKSVVVDPGPTSQAVGVVEVLRDRSVNLESVLLSHIHLDHGGGSWKVSEEFGCPVYCHPRGAPHMVDPSKLKAGAEKLFGEKVLEYGEIRGTLEKMVNESKDLEVLDLGGVTLEVHWTPGHSSHSQSYWEPDSKTVFVGDAVGHVIGEGGPVVPVSPPPHNPVKAAESIDRILALNPETLCIAHFGPHMEASVHLNRIKKRSILWEKLAVQAAKEEMSHTGLAELVKEEDDELMTHLKEVEASGDSLKGSLLGFWLYGKWKLEQG